MTNNKRPRGHGPSQGQVSLALRQNESDWARVVAPMAGSGRGFLYLPEVDDEVLVGFEHGDIHHPFVIGSLWNGQDKPPMTRQRGGRRRRQGEQAGHQVAQRPHHHARRHRRRREDHHRRQDRREQDRPRLAGQLDADQGAGRPDDRGAGQDHDQGHGRGRREQPGPAHPVRRRLAPSSAARRRRP